MSDSPDERSSSDEAIEAKAAAWLAERDGGMSNETAAEFARWRQEDPRHDATVERLESAWHALQQLRGFRPEARGHPDSDLLVRRVRTKWGMAPKLAMAAALAVMAGGAISRWAAEPTQTYSTTAAGYQHVLLADGTVMELRAETAVDVRFDATERRIRLHRGEAHFTVFKDARRPFYVDVGDVAVRAVGTAFNVVRASDRVEVLVTEGRVSIENAHPAPGSVAASTPDIQAGERAVLALRQSGARDAEPGPAPLVVEKLAPEKIREAIAWQGTRLVFYATPLADVVREFNRHNSVQLVLADAELGGIPVGGSFRAENLDAFVRLIAAGNGVEAARVGNRIELRRTSHRPGGPLK